MMAVVACGSSRLGEQATAPTEAATKATVATPAPTTVEATTITDVVVSSTVDRWERDLAGCVVGEWILDVEAFEDEIQAAMDPAGSGEVRYEVTSGSGSLSFAHDGTMRLSYQDLTILWLSIDLTGRPYPEQPDRLMVTSGWVTGVYEIDDDLLVLGGFDGSGVGFRMFMGDLEHRFHFFHPTTLAMSAELIPDLYPGVVTLGCDERRLVVRAVFDNPNVEVSPPVIWLREGDGR